MSLVPSQVHELETGVTRSFADWPIAQMQGDGAPGVYTVWNGTQFLYVGMSWKEGSKGLFGRLNSHASGRRSGDQFCIYACDLFIVPTLSKSQQLAVARAAPQPRQAHEGVHQGSVVISRDTHEHGSRGARDRAVRSGARPPCRPATDHQSAAYEASPYSERSITRSTASVRRPLVLNR